MAQGVARAEVRLKVADYDAVGDGHALDTGAIQNALDDCARMGGGKVVFPRGIYRSGTLHLRSRVGLVLEEGAVLRGSENLNDYLEPLSRTPGDKAHFVSWTASRRLFLYGDHLDQVSIEGLGTIDGNRVREKSGDRGPLSIFIQHSSNVTLQGVTVTRSPGWAVTFFDCRTVRILGVRLKDVMVDGIDPVSCQDVLYDGVTIDGSGDDPICLKNEGPPLPGGYLTRHIVVRHCTVLNTGHPAIKIGTGTQGVFEDILVEDSVFDLHGDLFAIQLMRPSLAGETERRIRNVTLRRLEVRNAKRVFDVTVLGVERPVIEGLRFEDIRFHGTAVDSRFLGTASSPIRDVAIRRLAVEASRPAAPWLNLRHVAGFRIEDSSVRLAPSETEGPVFCLDEVKDAVFAGVGGAVVDNLIRVSGERSGGIRLEGKVMGGILDPIQAGAEVREGALWPAAQLEILDLQVEPRLKSGDPIAATVAVANRGASGMVRVPLNLDGHESGAKWIWVAAGTEINLPLAGGALYRPGRHVVRVGVQARPVQVERTAADLRYGEFCEIEWARQEGGALKMVVPVKNVGGSEGAKRVVLYVDGRVAAAQEVRVAPGERAEVKFERVIKGASVRVGDFPEWRFSTFHNVPARFLLYRDKVVVEAGGRVGHWDDYAVVYLPEVEGDFDAQVRVLAATEDTGESSSVGLLVRNRMADTRSSGLSMHFRTPKYGGYKIWSWDADGDGQAEVRSDGGQAGMPVWYRFEKRGRTIRALHSSDGMHWQLSGLPWRTEFTSDSIGPRQDVGFFAMAWSQLGERTRAEFSDFTVKRVP
jgi:hypothetical protein